MDATTVRRTPSIAVSLGLIAFGCFAAIGCGGSDTTESGSASAPTGGRPIGSPNPAPAADIATHLTESPDGARVLTVDAIVADDSRYPDGAPIEKAELLLGDFTTKIAALPIALHTLPVGATSRLIELPWEPDLAVLTAGKEWLALRVEISFTTGGMTGGTAFIQQSPEGPRIASAAGFEQARAEFEQAQADADANNGGR